MVSGVAKYTIQPHSGNEASVVTIGIITDHI